MSFIRAYGRNPAIKIEELAALSAPCKAALLEMSSGDDALSFNSSTRSWLIAEGFARRTSQRGNGRHNGCHRTLELTALGRWWSQAILAYEADKLVAVAAELTTECA